MGASGCKLRSAKDRHSNKRSRDEEHEDESKENTDPQEKKARVEDEPSEYQKGLQQWTKDALTQHVLFVIKDGPRISHTVGCQIVQMLEHGDVNWNSESHRPGYTVFMCILEFIWNARIMEIVTARIQSGEIDVNVNSKTGRTPLMIMALGCSEYPAEGELFDAILEKSRPDIINMTIHDTSDNNNGRSAMILMILANAQIYPKIVFERMRTMEQHGADLNALDLKARTALHALVNAGASQCLMYWVQLDFAGFDWQLRNSNGKTAMQRAAENAANPDNFTLWNGTAWKNVEKSNANAVFHLMQMWDNRWRSVTRVDLDEHFPPDLSKIMCQYLDGTGGKFKSREEEEEAERQNSELEDIMNGTKPFVPPA